MSEYIIPCAAMGPLAKDRTFWSDRGYPFWRNPEIMQRSRTPWIRFWIDWFHLMPYDFRDPATDTRPMPGWPNMTPQQYLFEIVSNLRAARQDGKSIILTFWRTPPWANSQLWSTRFVQPGSRTELLGQAYCPPDDGFMTEWYVTTYYLCLLFNRWAPVYDGAWVDCLEVCNEPNVLWTATRRQGDQARRDWPMKASQMMVLASVAAAYTGNQPLILAPSIADTKRNEPHNDLWEFTDFTNRVFQWVPSGYKFERRVAWSMHNYGDIRDGNAGSNNNLVRARNILAANNWDGWPPPGLGFDAAPHIFATEGGALMTSSAVNGDECIQRDLVTSAWNRLRSAAGMTMMSNYLLWSTPGFDSGMCNVLPDPLPPHPGPPLMQGNGTIRRLVDGWAGMPTVYPRP